MIPFFKTLSNSPLINNLTNLRSIISFRYWQCCQINQKVGICMSWKTLQDLALFYLYGSVHHNIFYEITNRCSYMQSILFHCWVHSTCFGCFTNPSSGVQFLTVSTATGTNHSIVSATYSRNM
jgi:hypothetical protein